MPALSVVVGSDARAAMCAAFDRARASIDAEFYSIDDPAVVDSLNRAAARGVRVRVVLEGDTRRFSASGREPSDAAVRGALGRAIDVVVSRSPHALVHAKAAVVDGSLALVSTANPTLSGFDAPGEALVIDRNSSEARRVGDGIATAAAGDAPHSTLRTQLADLFRSPSDLRVASEDLSDPRIVAWLLHRARNGHRDRVLIGMHPSRSAKRRACELAAAGVDVRRPAHGYMHEKYVDAGSRVYLGSANLTRNGLEESHEIGIVADASSFDDGAAAVRHDFDAQWRQALAWDRA